MSVTNPAKVSAQLQKLNTPTALKASPQSTSTSNPLRLLVGKLVFLDLNSSYKPLSKVKECLSLIGARIADCLSKDVDYVISNREGDTTLDASKKTKTSPNALNIGSRSSFINRTQSILEKASKGFTSTDILSTARRLGINVMNISEIERYIEKYLNKTKDLKESNANKSVIRNECSMITASFQLNNLSNQKIYKLKNPFLKIESICKQYKPNYQEFKTWHEINLELFTSKNTSSPFQIYFSDDIKADDENEDEHSSSQNQNNSINVNENGAKKSVFKSPTSSTLVTSSTLNHLGNNAAVSKRATTGPARIPQSSSHQSGLNTANKNNLAGPKPLGNNNLVQLNATKRKTTGYCECCKQRYDNLKQHLTSVTHENFDRNTSNFKELDEYINGILNFKNFLKKNNLDSYKADADQDQVNMEEVKDLAVKFNRRRQSLGISQTQVILQINSYKEPVYDENSLARFEKLDITPRSAAKMKPAVERWLHDTDLKFADRLKMFSQPNSVDMSESSKKRKRLSFSIQHLEILNQAFNKNVQPSNSELESLSKQINFDQDLVSLWFKDKREILKKTTKKFKQGSLLSGLLNDADDNDSSSLLNSSKESLTGTATISATVSGNKASNLLTSSANKLKRQKSMLHQVGNQNCLTPIRFGASSLASSPSAAAAVLFTLNSNSFSIPNEHSHSIISNSASKLLATKIELINGNAELQTFVNDDNLHSKNLVNNISKSDVSTDLSCIDDSLINAFGNDFSYEIVHKINQ